MSNVVHCDCGDPKCRSFVSVETDGCGWINLYVERKKEDLPDSQAILIGLKAKGAIKLIRLLKKTVAELMQWNVEQEIADEKHIGSV